MDKFLEFPQDKNNNPVYSATRKKLVVLKGSSLWQDLIVPDGHECKGLLAIAHRGNLSDTQSLDEGLQYAYRTDSDAGADEWMPLASGFIPFAGKSGEILGQVLVSSEVWLTVLFLA